MIVEHRVLLYSECMEERSIRIKAHEISIRKKRKNNSTWIVLLHGLQSNKQVFAELLQQPLFQKYSILALDFVGFGSSSKPEDFSYDLQDQADVVEGVLDELKIESFHIIGHSMGGMVGILLLDQLKNRVLSLVNLEGNLVADDCGASISIVDAHTFADFSVSGYETFKDSQRKSKELGVEKRLKWISMIPDFAFYRSAAAIVRWSKSEKLLALFLRAPQKKLYVYGEKNREKGKRLPGFIEKAEIPNAGHRMLTDNLFGTYVAIENFYQKFYCRLS